MQRRRIGLLVNLAKPNLRYYIGALIATAMVVTINFTTPLLLAETVDAIIGDNPLNAPAFIVRAFEALGGRETFKNNLWIVGLVLIGLNLVNALAMFLKGRWNALSSEAIARTLRGRLYTRLQNLSYDYHVKAETGDLIQRCTSDVETVRRFLSMQLLEIANALFLIIMAVCILWGRNPTLTMMSLIMVPPLLISSFVFSKRVMKTFRTADEAEGKMSSTLQESLTGVRVVRAFGRQQHEVEKFDAVSTDYSNKVQRIVRLMAVFWSGGDLLSMGQTAITLLVGIRFAANGTISLGSLLVFISYVGMMLGPVRQLGRLLSDAGKALVSIERIDEILRQPLDEDAEGSVQAPLDGDIVFDDVSFAYKEGHPVLDHVSFTLPHGKTAAILGATGSGKSTLVHLLQRLYEPTGGKITIGGRDIKTIEKKWLRQHVGLVLQEPFLYSKTVRENLAIVKPDAPQAEVERVARIAQADGFIREAEKGYDTLVGERGVTLSGGQKQRVAIARTLLKDNQVLIFDDSLSAVDTQTDSAIRRALQSFQKGVTRIIISHRITTLQEADLILVLSGGRIIQQGTHAQLIAQPGLYQRIHHIQNELEDELQDQLESEVKPHAVV